MYVKMDGRGIEMSGKPRSCRLFRSLVVLMVVTALSTLVFSGCAPKRKAPPPITGKIAGVAPIFSHGESDESAPCFTVNPPVYIPEDEARDIIVDELGKEGLWFVSGDKKIAEVPVLVEDIDFDGDGNVVKVTREEPFDIDMDGMDGARSIAFEVVSVDDVSVFEGHQIFTDEKYSMCVEKCASKLRDGFEKAKPDCTVAVFYCPASPLYELNNDGSPKRDQYREFAGGDKAKAYKKELETNSKKRSEKELRKQVQDFVAWLKTEGVI